MECPPNHASAPAGRLTVVCLQNRLNMLAMWGRVKGMQMARFSAIKALGLRNLSLPLDEYRPIRIPISKRPGMFALVDPVDHDLLYRRWHESHGYVIDSTGCRLHREVLGRTLGRTLLPGEQVDHLNHHKLDNRRRNLRLATSSQQQANKRLTSRNKSGYIGVSLGPDGDQWRADIRFNRRRTFLGLYPTPTLAAFIRDYEARKYPEQFHELNFPVSERINLLFERQLVELMFKSRLSKTASKVVREIINR